MPFFSIIIATLNAEKTIHRCLASLVKQHFRSFEILIVDGGSTDRTLEYIASFGSLPIYVTSEPDSGLYDALNKGILTTSGQWINILGADDELLPSALDTVKAAITRYPADIYAGFARLIDNQQQKTMRVDVCDFRTLVGAIPFCHNAMFASRHAYEVVGLYDLSYKIVADAHWVHRAIRAGMRFHTIERPLVHFYAGGVSANPEQVLSESYSLIQENFPCLSVEEAQQLLFISKGWNDGAELDNLLGRHPEEAELAHAARAAKDYAPHCAQRRMERKSAPIELWKKIIRTIRGTVEKW